jgi:hypothetical protein
MMPPRFQPASQHDSGRGSSVILREQSIIGLSRICYRNRARRNCFGSGAKGVMQGHTPRELSGTIRIRVIAKGKIPCTVH